MLKKSFSAIISVVLAFAICVCTCSSAFAASSGKKYISEVILSYGKTEEDAKNWLINNGYQVLDNNLNDGADATLSTKRAVYLGYKTTDKADEAITDMKLMNMKGGYSVQDYQMLLSEQKSNIQVFIGNFIVAVNEYRANYAAKQARAVAAHDMLNLFYDDDTQQNMGDLLLSRIREEYTDEEYNALSAEEQAKIADMTTILMQGSANAVTAIEQLIATATDGNDTLWTERYLQAKTYDEMLDDLIDSDNLSVNQAEKQLAADYDDDAKQIAANFESYKTYLEKNYVNSGITLESTEEEIEAYQNANEDFDINEWLALGTQYELLKVLKNDDISLYDLITSDEYDPLNEERYLLYPLVSVLTEGQRACLDFLPTYQLMSLGINDDAATKEGMRQANITSSEVLQNTSVYDGVDRTVFGEDVALTGDAYKLQASSGKNPTDSWTDYVSASTVILLSSLAVSTVVTGVCWKVSSYLSNLSEELTPKLGEMADKIISGVDTIAPFRERVEQYQGMMLGAKTDKQQLAMYEEKLAKLRSNRDAMISTRQAADTWSKALHVAGLVMICITAVLLIASLWSTVVDIIDYYNAKYTPIPSNMVNQGVDENDEKVFTYYKAVKCNRVQQNMVDDDNKLLGDYGDLNGDVGRQWVALYTTKDKAAGDPITINFRVQYNNTKIPGDRVPLSIFCESTAQNLTNEKAGYTYNDGKNGIYLYYGVDESAFAGSIISDGAYYVLVGGTSAIVAAAIAFFAGKSVGKKGKKEEEIANA